MTRGLARTAVIAAAGLLVMAATPAIGAASEGELQISAAPAATLALRDDAWAMGPLMTVNARYGLPLVDWLVAEVALQWSRLTGLAAQVGSHSTVLFDAQRFGCTASALVRLGDEFSWLLGLGVGYRVDVLSNEQRIGASAGAAMPRRNSMVGVASASFEWRFHDRWGAALWTALDIAPRAAQVGITGGGAMSLHLWP